MSEGAAPGETKRMGEYSAASASVSLMAGNACRISCVPHRERSVGGKYATTAATRLDSLSTASEADGSPGVGRRTEQQRELPTGAAAQHANAVGVEAVLARVLADEADRPPRVRHDRGHRTPRAAAVSHGEYGEPLLVQRGIVALGDKTAHLHARLPPVAHDRDDAGAVGLCRTVHVERERQAVLVPVHHIGRHRGLRLGGPGSADSGHRR